MNTDLKTLSNKLRNYVKEHPEIREIKIERPLFIVGNPRTGTTLLLNLLAQDARAPLLWEMYHLTPPPKDLSKPVFTEQVKKLSSRQTLIPQFDKIHQIVLEGPEVENQISTAFSSPIILTPLKIGNKLSQLQFVFERPGFFFLVLKQAGGFSFTERFD